MKKFPMLIWMAMTAIGLYAQPYEDVEPSRFDFGKMWTFEHAPLDYLEETYDFRPDADWLENTRMASLRFATFCSGSFISPEGLILTNHHCSRGEAGKVMEEGEDFDLNGYYAAQRSAERKVPGLFVKQLVKMEDITVFVKGYTDQAENDEEFNTRQAEALEAALENYRNKKEWAGLELETVTYYSGGKYSLYGYKRYDDIRLVLIPEQQLGFFGGDPDNFTYPRYNLDFTLWRAYENGEPLNTSDHYFQVDPEGADENELIFAVGNPARTERYHTLAQLEFDRDYRYNIFLKYLENKIKVLEAINEEAPDYQREELILNIANSVKAYRGIVGGLRNPYLMGKKANMEKQIKTQSKAVASGKDYWKQLEEAYDPLEEINAERLLLSPNPFAGNVLMSAHYFQTYVNALEGGAGEADQQALKEQVMTTAAGIGDPHEDQMLAYTLAELKQYADPGDDYVAKLLDGKSPDKAAQELIAKTRFSDPEKLEKLLDGKVKKMKKSKDLLVQLSNELIPRHQEASMIYKEAQARIAALQGKIANEVYQVYGLSIPPDATFTLRLADGMVKGYDYNGTRAPFKTTFYGMYDRYYSNGGAFPWSLPQRWLNPSSALLRSPLNFVATSDSIGGSSGSPIIDKDGKLIGLLFDGNIESLPGNFIYDSMVNRSVGVHAGGITAALKYIYEADRILRELGL